MLIILVVSKLHVRINVLYVIYLVSPFKWLFMFSFEVSLICSCNTEKDDKEVTDVALKLSARFAERQFLRNARISGKWSEAEATIPYFPFIQDQPFRVIIRL